MDLPLLRGIDRGADDDARMLYLSGDGELTRLPGFDSVVRRDTWYAGSAIVNDQVFGTPLGTQLLHLSPPIRERTEDVGATQRSLLG